MQEIKTDSMKSTADKFYEWLGNRLGLGQFIAFVSQKKVPVHRQSYWYYLGGILIMLLIVQLLSGIMLMVYYVPEIGSAYSSVNYINSQVDFGWFFRSMHSWGSNLMVFFLFLHLLSTFFMRAYRFPRELTWVTGMIMLFIILGLAFTGYLLPWDKLAFFATNIGIDIASKTPLIGENLGLLLRGGEIISQATLSRFFAFHVIFLPLLLLPVLVVHIILVQLHGNAEPWFFRKQPKEKRYYEPFFPDFFLKNMMILVFVINLLVVFIMLFPVGIGDTVDVFAPAPVDVKPEWYFLAIFQFLKLLPSNTGPIEGNQAGIAICIIIGLSLFLIPFWDHGRSLFRGELVKMYMIGLVFIATLLTLWGYCS